MFYSMVNLFTAQCLFSAILQIFVDYKFVCFEFPKITAVSKSMSIVKPHPHALKSQQSERGKRTMVEINTVHMLNLFRGVRQRSSWLYATF